MSVTVTTDLVCDECATWDDRITVIGQNAKAAEARRNARQHGWKRSGRRDICPACLLLALINTSSRRSNRR